MREAERERIRLPFLLWLLPATARLPGRRPGRPGKRVVAVLVNHPVFMGW